jgi:hypothetical protein
MISKYTKNSKIHQALEALAFFPMDANELRRKISFRESMQRFEHYIVAPMTSDKMVKLVDYKFVITDIGLNRLEQLGSVKKSLPPTPPRTFVPEKVEAYRGNELREQTMRPEANTHLGFPSRIGNSLHYRDGRVVAA